MSATLLWDGTRGDIARSAQPYLVTSKGTGFTPLMASFLNLWSSSIIVLFIHTAVVIEGYIISGSENEQLPVKSVRRALVPSRVAEQILLVIVLGIVPGPRRLYSRDDLLLLGRKMLLLHLLRYTMSNRLLFGSMEENSGAVFCTSR